MSTYAKLLRVGLAAALIYTPLPSAARPDAGVDDVAAGVDDVAAGVDAGIDDLDGELDEYWEEEGGLDPDDVPVLDQGGESHFRTVCIFEAYPAAAIFTQLDGTLRRLGELLEKRGIVLERRYYAEFGDLKSDRKDGLCDAVAVPGALSLGFGAALEAPGGVTDARSTRRLLYALAKDGAAPLLREGGEEVAGIQPIGFSALLMREGVPVSGRTVAFPRDDLGAQLLLADGYGAVTTGRLRGRTCMAAKAENLGGCVAILPLQRVPEGFEVRHGIGLATYQLVIRSARFPERFGRTARRHFAARAAGQLDEIEAATDVASAAQVIGGKIEDRMTSVRLDLRDNGLLPDKPLTLLFKVRCYVDRARAECVGPGE